MRRTLLALALAAPLAALAAPPPERGPGGPESEARRAEMQKRMQKRMRLARTLGLAEALDLSEAEALKLRETLTKFDERLEPLRKQMRESMDELRKAARGDAAAQKGVDATVKKLRELRGQTLAVRDEMFNAISKDLSPEKKARAAMVLLKHRAMRMRRGMGMHMERMEMGMEEGMERMRERMHELHLHGPRGGPMPPGGPGAMGPGPQFGMGPPGDLDFDGDVEMDDDAI